MDRRAEGWLMLFDQGAAHVAECTDLVPTARATACSPDQWSRARVAAASLFSKALGNVRREWLAEQIGRSVSRVEAWFEISPKAPAPPLTLLVAERADGGGFVLDDQELERFFALVRAHRALVGGRR